MRTEDLDAIDWEQLSIDALWVLSRIVMPMTRGETQGEVAQRLGLTRAQVGTHMARLRAELREQLDETAA